MDESQSEFWRGLEVQLGLESARGFFRKGLNRRFGFIPSLRVYGLPCPGYVLDAQGFFETSGIESTGSFPLFLMRIGLALVRV